MVNQWDVGIAFGSAGWLADKHVEIARHADTPPIELKDRKADSSEAHPRFGLDVHESGVVGV
jgi:hypothetical protein